MSEYCYLLSNNSEVVNGCLRWENLKYVFSWTLIIIIVFWVSVFLTYYLLDKRSKRKAQEEEKEGGGRA